MAPPAAPRHPNVHASRAAVDRSAVAAWDEIRADAAKIDDLDLVDATMVLGRHFLDRITVEGLAYTLAYFALRVHRDEHYPPVYNGAADG